MSKYIRDMSGEEVMNLPTLGLDDTFEFTCKACGKCCKHREDIILTPYDLFRIAKYLGRTPEEIVVKYCEVYEGQQSHFPIVRVLPVPLDNACPFLRGKKCSVHSMKPVVCRVYPLGRLTGGEEGGVRYVFSGASCKHEPRSITVREWIADVASDEAEQVGKLWGEVMTVLFPLIQPSQIADKDARERMLTVLFGGLYLAYDMQQPFVAQLRENFEKLKEIFEPVAEHD